MRIVQVIHIEYFKIEIYVQLKFQKIIILIIMIIYIKNVIIHVKNVVNQEMKQIIIVMNVKMIILFLMNLYFQIKIVLKNVIIIIILMKVFNILVLNRTYAQQNIIK